MLPRWSKLWTLLCLVLVIQLVSAAVIPHARRQDDGENGATRSVATGTIATRTDPQSRATAEPTNTNTEAPASRTGESSADKTGTAEDKTESITSFTGTATGTGASHPTTTSSVVFDNSTLVNATIPHGQLPIQPHITPGWGVAGIIMLLTGVAHTLIGIKNRAIHTFFSTAYVAALGIAVLIVYVMTLPVSNALQGGYVVAIVVSGCAVGAAAMFFRELTEGLGCALGGFCVSMWLLCLVDGGLLQAVASKAIFIACFTLGGFIFYFSRYTRDWALIVMIAISGATVTILGIDCFSRAGLKEFWAYIWALNAELFPLGADTYPVTKGIRVELAAIVIVALIGIISQIKLWKIVREQRAKRAEEIAEGQRVLQEEEENVGRNVEEQTARDRRQWERAYGEGDVASSTVSRGSENGDLPQEKRPRSSHTVSSPDDSEVIEMSDMANHNMRQSLSPSLMASQYDQEGKITVRVAVDDMPQSPIIDEVNEKPGHASSDGQTLVPGVDDKRISQMSSVSSRFRGPEYGPEIVPLPFTIPVGDDVASDAERSSVATFADDEEDLAPPATRHSLATRLSRLSQGSHEMLKRLSRGSLLDHPDEADPGESTEGLVIQTRLHRNSDDGSVAATFDDSVSDLDRRSLPSKSIEITAELSDNQVLSPTESEQPKSPDADVKSTAEQSKGELLEEPAAAKLERTKSATSAVSSPISLTKDRLPRSLSRVAMSYRTNEWAKHLSQADAPEPDVIHVDEMVQPEVSVIEKPAPVYIEDLQKSADQGTPAPAMMTRSDSQASNLSNAYSMSLSRRGSKQAVPASLALLTGNMPGEINRSPNGTPPALAIPRSGSAAMRRTSGGTFEPIAEEHSFAAAPIPEEGIVSRHQSTSPAPVFDSGRLTPAPGVVSYASPQTLIGQREMLLRNRSQGNLLASPSDLNLNQTSSDAGSLYNYPMYAAAVGADVDDLPLSQRKQLMRQASLNGPSSSTPNLLPRVASGNDLTTAAESPFDSHQPRRTSGLQTPAAREAALIQFRQSVQQDLRSGTPVINNTGRETPFTPASLLGGGREAEVQREIEMGRNILMGQKEAEAQRREMQIREKEWADRAFNERMRSGDLLEVHREAMRRMQKNAKDG